MYLFATQRDFYFIIKINARTAHITFYTMYFYLICVMTFSRAVLSPSLSYFHPTITIYTAILFLKYL